MEKLNNENELKFFGGELISFLPIITYIALAMFLAFSFNSLSMKSVTIGGIIGIFITFLFAKNKDTYWKTIISGLTKPGNASLIFTFILIGLFTTLLTSGQIGQGLVWISQVLNLTGGAFVVFAFVASMLVAIGSGAPIAAVFALVPILYPSGIMLGANPAVLLGAIISGILCGDSFAPTSQNTVTAAASQTFKGTGESVNPITVIGDRSKYIIAIALVSAVLFFINGTGAVQVPNALPIDEFSNPMGLTMLIPLIMLIFICVKTRNLFKGLSYGIITALAVGLLGGLFSLSDIINVQEGALQGLILNGVYSMIDVVVSTLLLFGMIQIMIQGGGITKVSDWISSYKFVQKPMGAELVIALFCVIINIFIAGCPLPAVLLISSFVDHLGKKANLHPSRRAYLMVGSLFGVSVIAPFSSIYIMSEMTMMKNLNIQYQLGDISISAFDIFANTYFSLGMTLLVALWIFTGMGRKYDVGLQTSSHTTKKGEIA